MHHPCERTRDVLPPAQRAGRGSMSARYLVPMLVVVTAVLAPQLGYATSPERDEGRIVFSSEHAGGNEIWVMNADGTEKRNMTRHDGAKFADLEPRWSPDGRQIAFVSGPGIESFKDRQIWVMNMDGSNARQLTTAPGFARSPAWTSDGKAIVFQATDAGNVDIYRVNLDGTGLTDLTNHPAVDRAPATSPHGKKIVFTSERGGSGHLYVLDTDGSLEQITDGPGYDVFASWSPRGNEIVFTRDDGTQADLFLIHADGTAERRLTNTPGVIELFPAFSPDGRRLAYSRCTPSPGIVPNLNCKIHTMNLDGTGDFDLGFPPLSVPFPIVESFDDNTRNVELWSLFHSGTGGFVQWANGRLEMSIVADGKPSNTEGLGAHVGANCLLRGDFDAEVEYQLLTWPAGNGVNAGINAFFTNGSITRTTNVFGDAYTSSIAPVFGAVPTSDQAGSVRLVRSGSTMTSYYRKGGAGGQLAPGAAH